MVGEFRHCVQTRASNQIAATVRPAASWSCLPDGECPQLCVHLLCPRTRVLHGSPARLCWPCSHRHRLSLSLAGAAQRWCSSGHAAGSGTHRARLASVSGNGASLLLPVCDPPSRAGLTLFPACTLAHRPAQGVQMMACSVREAA